jgi:hypothetical protein
MKPSSPFGAYTTVLLELWHGMLKGKHQTEELYPE